MIIRLIEGIGDKTIGSITSLYNFLIFSTVVLSRLFYFRSYNQKTIISLVTQIYYTSVIVIPHFIVIASFFGSLIIGTLIIVSMQFNFQTQIGSIITTFVFNELAPLFTTIFISLRSGTLVNKKFANMRGNDENKIIDLLAIPRVISGIVSTLTLSILFSAIVLGSGYIVIFVYMGMDFHTYKFLILDAVSVGNVLMLLIKSTLYGFITMVVPIYNGLRYNSKKVKERLSVVSLISHIFSTIFFIEIILFLLISTLKGS